MEKHDENTLVIKHLPSELSVNDRVDFLKHLGATEVRCIVSEFKKASLTFAQFKSKERCLAVLRSLHQKDILGSVVSVEFSKEKKKDNTDSSQVQGETTETTSQRKIVENYLKKLNSWTNNADFSQPPPAHIRYSYPPPSTQVLRNICTVLAKVPKFYTQVLHLMNKMNLPCPFSEDFDVQTDMVSDDFEPVKDETPVKAYSEEESEIESDPESKTPIACVQKVMKRPKKAVKISKVVQPKLRSENRAVVRPEEVFESSQVRVHKKIEVIVSADLSVHADTSNVSDHVEGFGLIEPVPKTEDDKELEADDKKDDVVSTGVISLEELEMNRIPSKDFYLLPVFKNYQPGPPSCRLYIKNLAKTVTSSDLEFIFGRYRVEESGDQVNLYDIRLMQEGRMKGQAFVTLQSVELAEKAVKETNGYILKGKAIVVQFARSNKPK